MAPKNNEGSQPVPIEPSLLEWAEYWYPVSWKGVLAGGIITAVGACATIAFLLLQWRTTSIREEQSELRTVTLEAQTAQAYAALGVAQADIAKANAQIAEANERTENLRHQNLELESAVAPRMLQQWPAAEPLRQFSGMQVFVSFVPDFEARRFAGQLFPLLQMGGWNPQWNPLDTPVMDGVEIEFEGGLRYDPNFPGDLMKAETNANKLQENAAQALLEVLKKQKIEARVIRLPFSRTEKPRRPGVPPDAISIRVGAKPIEYFMDQRFPGHKESREEIKKNIEDAERRRRE